MTKRRPLSGANPPKRFLSLPTRLALAVTAALIVVMLVAGILATRELRRKLFGLVSANLTEIIGHLADSLDADLKARLDLLAREAAELAGSDPEGMAAHLRERGRELAFAFDGGVIAVDEEGKVSADSLDRTGWGETNLAEEEFFQRTFVLGNGVASEPFRLPLPGVAAGGRPAVVAFTAPLHTPEGRMRGVLAGLVNLGENRLFKLITEVGVGSAGQVGVFTRDGVVIAHSDRRLILERFENPLPEGKINPGGVSEIRLADGSEALLSLRELPGAGWLVAGVFSSRDVFSPVEEGFKTARLWFGLGLVVCGLLAWLLSWWLVRDLERLAEDIKRIGEMGDRVGKGYRGEVGEVARSVNGMLESLEAARREIGALSRRLEEAGEGERRVIAGELHDSVCQNLALANMRLGGLKKGWEGTREGETIFEVRGILEESVGELRSLIFHLSPNILYELGLGAALEWQAGEFGRKHALVCEFRQRGDFSGLAEAEAIFLYRAAAELLQNVQKHAKAERVWLELSRGDNGWTCLSVRDDGRGFAGPASHGAPGGGVFSGSERGGFGLRHLRERVRQFGGEMYAGADASGSGARVELRLPFVAGTAPASEP